MSDTLREIANEATEINVANGWDLITPEAWLDKRWVPSLLALVHSEVSECLEDFRANDLEHFGEECADVAIRLIDMAYGLGIDLRAEIDKKLEKNRQRAKQHGGKRI